MSERASERASEGEAARRGGAACRGLVSPDAAKLSANILLVLALVVAVVAVVLGVDDLLDDPPVRRKLAPLAWCGLVLV